MQLLSFINKINDTLARHLKQDKCATIPWIHWIAASRQNLSAGRPFPSLLAHKTLHVVSSKHCCVQTWKTHSTATSDDITCIV